MCGNLTSRIIWFLTPLFPSAQVIYGRKTFFGIFHPIFSFNIIWAKWAKLISQSKIIFGAKISNKIILFFVFQKRFPIIDDFSHISALNLEYWYQNHSTDWLTSFHYFLRALKFFCFMPEFSFLPIAAEVFIAWHASESLKVHHP